MKKYQESSEKKNKQLSNYLGDDIHTLAKRDEAAYIKAVQEKDEKARRKEEEEMRKNLRTKNMNKESLSYQMQEKGIQK